MLIFRLLFGEKRALLGLPRWPYFNTGDQKGIYMNEAESKNCGSVSFAGADEEAALKTHHAQSRSRTSIWTSVTNDPGHPPPLGICFKLKTNRCLKHLVIPEGSPFLLDHSKSGSYNYDATIRFLKGSLLPMTPERIATWDYRIQMLDDYKVHNMKEVSDLCWEHGFLKLKIGGGTTFCLCNCDLDCHADMEAQYLDLDNQWAARELKERPWRVPSKDRQSVVDDLSVIWHHHDHARKGLNSFKWSGLAARPPERVYKPGGGWAVPLVGPDDFLINRDARTFFQANQMPHQRQHCLTKIYQDFDEGKINEWEDVRNYVFDYSDSEAGGEHEEGEELLSEHPLSDGPETDLDEDCPIDSGDGPDGAPVAASDALVVASDGALAPASGVSSECAIAKEGRAFTELIEHARNTITDPRLVQTLAYYQKQRERGLRFVDKDALRVIQEERQEALDQAAVTRKQLYLEDKERQQKLKEERDKRKEKEQETTEAKEAKRKLALDELRMDKKDWNLGHFGQGKTDLTKDAIANMREALERLRLRAPDLPPHVEAQWKHFVENFPAWIWKKEYAAPLKFLNFLTEVQTALGRYYISNPLKPEKRRKIDHGDPDAFSKWVERVIDVYGVGKSLRL